MQNGNLADWFISFLLYICIWTFQKFRTYVFAIILAFALRNNLVQELVLTRLLEMSKPHLLCQKQYLFSFLSSEASAYVLFNPILSLQLIGLRRHFLCWTGKQNFSDKWKLRIRHCVWCLFLQILWLQYCLTSNFIRNLLFTFCKMGARQLFSVWINRNITMNNQATFHITK